MNKTDVLEGILIVTDERYIYEWRTQDPKISGTILFVGKQWKDHEKLVFSMCRSVVIAADATWKTPLKPNLEDLRKSIQVHCSDRR